MGRYHQLTRNHRYQIERWLKRGKSKNEIAKLLGVHRSTVYREIMRNSYVFPLEGLQYDSDTADVKAFEKRCRRREQFRKIKGDIKRYVEEKIRCGWSPEQIAGRLKHEGVISISTETIYRYILEDSYGYGDLFRYLRVWRYKKSRFVFGSTKRRRWVAPRRPLEQRPEEAKQRTEVGHWERDLVMGPRGKSCLLTIVDRKSRFTIIRKLSSRKSSGVYKKIHSIFNKNKLPIKTITNDNGIEFMDHSDLEASMGIKVYFTRPHAPWEKGTNENTNGLIREYFPKKTNFDEISDYEIKEVERTLNLRPRKVLKYQTPIEVLNNVQEKFFDHRESRTRSVKAPLL